MCLLAGIRKAVMRNFRRNASAQNGRRSLAGGKRSAATGVAGL